MKRDEAWRSSPVRSLVPYEVVVREADCAQLSLAVREEFLQEEGVVHGGILSCLADSAAVALLYPSLGDGESMTSIEFKLNFLRPVTLAGGEILADAHLVRRGRTVAVVDVDLSQGGKHAVKGLFTYLIWRPQVRTDGERDA